jgi:hypothetical protein
LVDIVDAAVVVDPTDPGEGEVVVAIDEPGVCASPPPRTMVEELASTVKVVLKATPIPEQREVTLLYALSTSSTGHRVAAHDATPFTKAVFVQKQLNSERPFSVSQAATPGTVDNVEHWSV